MNQFRRLGLIAFASFAGVLCSELVFCSAAFRDAAERVFGHGLIIEANLRRVSLNEQVDPAKVDREIGLLCAQFGEEESFLEGVRSSGLSILSLRERITDQQRSLQWLERKIATALPPTESKCRDYYESHRELFRAPMRFRVSHVFLAAPADTPPEVVESKQALIDLLAVRLGGGETLSQLAAEASEDEATKSRGGDLGFFSSLRMPAEFFSAVETLTMDHASKPFRSHLGFHIVQVTEIRPARLLGFDEARGEISLTLANERRALIAKGLADMLSFTAYARSD